MIPPFERAASEFDDAEVGGACGDGFLVFSHLPPARAPVPEGAIS